MDSIYIFTGPWPLQEKFNINHIMGLRNDHMMILKYLDESLNVDCCAFHLSKAVNLSLGATHNRLIKLVELELVCKTKEEGDPSELCRPLKNYYALTDLGARALEHMSQAFK